MTQLALNRYQNRHSLKSKMARMVWHIVWALLFRPTPTTPRVAKIWRVFLLRIFGAKVNWRAGVSPSCKIWQPWNLDLDDCSIGDNVRLYSVDKIRIGHFAVVSSESYLCTASHDISSPIMELITAPIKIESQAWVAGDACVLPGVNIGEGAIVGARAVVAKNVAPWAVVVGNPAKQVGVRQLRAIEE